MGQKYQVPPLNFKKAQHLEKIPLQNFPVIPPKIRGVHTLQSTGGGKMVLQVRWLV